jgi:hypothetical protein
MFPEVFSVKLANSVTRMRRSSIAAAMAGKIVRCGSLIVDR